MTKDEKVKAIAERMVRETGADLKWGNLTASQIDAIQALLDKKAQPPVSIRREPEPAGFHETLRRIIRENGYVREFTQRIPFGINQVHDAMRAVYRCGLHDARRSSYN